MSNDKMKEVKMTACVTKRLSRLLSSSILTIVIGKIEKREREREGERERERERKGGVGVWRERKREI